MAAGAEDGVAEEVEEEGLGDLFQTLPAIRRFEGKHYKSRKDGVKDLAAQVSISGGREDR